MPALLRDCLIAKDVDEGDNCKGECDGYECKFDEGIDDVVDNGHN